MGKEDLPILETEQSLKISFGMATARRENPPKEINQDSINVKKFKDAQTGRNGFLFVICDAVTNSGNAYILGHNSEGHQVADVIPLGHLASTSGVKEMSTLIPGAANREEVINVLSQVNNTLIADSTRRDIESEAHKLGVGLWAIDGPPVTTLVAILIPDREIRDKRNRQLKSDAFAISIGDSRIYASRSRGLREIFPQHDVNDLGQLILTMGMYEEDFLARMEALGTHIKLLRLTPGTRLYLTSDGIDRGVIEEIEKNYSHLSPQEKADRAIERQRELYGNLPDDASIIVIDVA